MLLQLCNVLNFLESLKIKNNLLFDSCLLVGCKSFHTPGERGTESEFWWKVLVLSHSPERLSAGSKVTRARMFHHLSRSESSLWSHGFPPVSPKVPRVLPCILKLSCSWSLVCYIVNMCWSLCFIGPKGVCSLEWTIIVLHCGWSHHLYLNAVPCWRKGIKYCAMCTFWLLNTHFFSGRPCALVLFWVLCIFKGLFFHTWQMLV